MYKKYFSLKILILFIFGTFLLGCVNSQSLRVNQSSQYLEKFLQLIKEDKLSEARQYVSANLGYFKAYEANSSFRRIDLYMSSCAFFPITNCIAILLEKGANPNTIFDFSSTVGKNATVLHVVTANGNIRSTEILLKAGANPNVQNSNGVTPLHFARRYGFLQIEQLLRKHGADGSIRDTRRWLSADEVNIEKPGGFTGGEKYN